MTPDGGPIGRGVEWWIDLVAGWFNAIEEKVTPRWVRRWELRRRAVRVREHIAWIRATIPASMRRAEMVASELETLAAVERELVDLCDHRWRPNVAWSHLDRCDRCGIDRAPE